jgi:hypothetical protein
MYYFLCGTKMAVVGPSFGLHCVGFASRSRISRSNKKEVNLFSRFFIVPMPPPACSPVSYRHVGRNVRISGGTRSPTSE